MAETHTKPTRRVLVDVPVNTPSRLYALSSSTGKSAPGKHIMTNATSLHAGRKRSIQEVDDPESPPYQDRMLMSRQDVALGATIYIDEVREQLAIKRFSTMLIDDHRNQMQHVRRLHRSMIQIRTPSVAPRSKVSRLQCHP